MCTLFTNQEAGVTQSVNFIFVSGESFLIIFNNCSEMCFVVMSSSIKNY